MLSPESITDKYFEHLLNREITRQHLSIRWEDQMEIFENLAKSFAEFDITGETRAFVKELIIDYNRTKLLFYRELMPEKQTLEELSDTLTNHALLNRIGNKDFISFINEFVFGYLLGKAIEKDETDFLGKGNPLPEYLLELALQAFQFSSQVDKEFLWTKLDLVKENMSHSLKLQVDSILKKEIYGDYVTDGFNSFNFTDVLFDSHCYFEDVSFVDSYFEDCIFNAESFKQVTFTGCKFNNCEIIPQSENDLFKQVHCYGCDDFNSGFIKRLSNIEEITIPEDTKASLSIQILGRYFKVDGKTPKMKYISSIRRDFENENLDEVFEVFHTLRKQGYILIGGNNSYISKKGITFFHKNNKQ